MQIFLNQAEHNVKFLKSLDANYPEDYYDWKITVAFYSSLHYIKFLLKTIYKIDVGTHIDINSTHKTSKWTPCE
jgi:hypothetical protein